MDERNFYVGNTIAVAVAMVRAVYVSGTAWKAIIHHGIIADISSEDARNLISWMRGQAVKKEEADDAG